MENKFVRPELLNEQDVQRYRAGLAAAVFVDGSVSAGPLAVGVKRNKQAADATTDALAEELIRVLFGDGRVGRAVYPHRATRPLFNRYDAGDYYGHHEDNPLQSGLRADVSFTLFLSDPDEYEGGALVIDGKPHREAAGTVLLYPSGTPHHVEPVVRGARYAAIGWIQSLLRDPAKRMLLRTFSTGLNSLRDRTAEDGEDLHALNRVRNQLMRMWAEL